MNKTETINTQSGFALQVQTRSKEDNLEIQLQAPAGKNCLLHWGLQPQTGQAWQLPPENLWPAGTLPSSGGALDSPFAKQNGQASLLIRVSPASAFDSLDFVLFFPDEKRW